MNIHATLPADIPTTARVVMVEALPDQGAGAYRAHTVTRDGLRIEAPVGAIIQCQWTGGTYQSPDARQQRADSRMVRLVVIADGTMERVA